MAVLAIKFHKLGIRSGEIHTHIQTQNRKSIYIYVRCCHKIFNKEELLKWNLSNFHVILGGGHKYYVLYLEI